MRFTLNVKSHVEVRLEMCNKLDKSINQSRRKNQVTLIKFQTPTSVGYFLSCSFSNPTVAACYQEGPPTDTDIEVCWTEMLCCSFIATPDRVKEHHSKSIRPSPSHVFALGQR